LVTSIKGIEFRCCKQLTFIASCLPESNSDSFAWKAVGRPDDFQLFSLQMNDKLSSLQLFVRVAHRSSFTKAGRELGLSQPSVSGRIAELEEALHVDLQMADDRQDLIVEGVDVAYRIVIRHGKG
jgi:DNA-binding transcriptional ArsR family regulator